MRKISLIGIIVVLIAGLASAVVFAGLRVVVFAPGNSQPGKTIVASGLRDLRIVDSPDAYCQREGDTDPTCPISFAVAIAHEGHVLLELPYFGFLNALAGHRSS